MGGEAIALGIIFGWLGVTAGVGALATYLGFRRVAAVDAWFVAGRRLGLLVLWLSLGANIYSAYTFLGLPGLAAREGGKVWAITLYGMISYLIGYIVVPRMWSKAKGRGWLTLADAFEDIYGSRAVGAFTAIAGALWSIPYIQLQIQGIGYIIETASYGAMDPVIAKVIAFTLIAIFTVVGGLMSVVFINMLQGALMLAAVWFIGIAAPLIAFGSLTNLFNVLQSYQLSQPAGSNFSLFLKPGDVGWFLSIIFIAPLAFWLWPNRVQNVFGAKDIKTTKRNMVAVSVYQIAQIPAILVGLTAIALFATGSITMPVFKKPFCDYSFMLVTRVLFPPWVVGLIGAGAMAASISTAAAILHVSGALFSRNVWQRLLRPSASRRELLLSARLFTAVIAVASLVLALYAPGILIYLLLVGYAGIVQMFPQYILGMYRPGTFTRNGALAGMATGMAIVAYIKVILRHLPLGIYEGFWGLMGNLAVASIVSLAEKRFKT